MGRVDAGPERRVRPTFPRTVTQQNHQDVPSTWAITKYTPAWPFPDLGQMDLHHLTVFPLPPVETGPTQDLCERTSWGRTPGQTKLPDSPADAGRLSSQGPSARTASRQRGHMQRLDTWPGAAEITTEPAPHSQSQMTLMRGQ